MDEHGRKDGSDARTVLEMSIHDLTNDVARLSASVSLLGMSPGFASLTGDDRALLASLDDVAVRLRRRQQFTNDVILWMRDPVRAASRLTELRLESTVERWVAAEAARGRPITHSVPPAPVVVRGFEPAVMTLLDNLAGNSIKFGATSVVIRVSTEAGRAIMACEDDGPGFAPEEVPHVFELGYRGPSQATRVMGTGAGLAGCRLIARRLGAEISAGNRPNGGAVLSVSFPIV